MVPHSNIQTVFDLQHRSNTGLDCVSESIHLLSTHFRSCSGRVAALTLRWLNFWIALGHMGFRSCWSRNDGCWVMDSLPVRAQSAPDPSPAGLHQTREQNRKKGTRSSRSQNQLPSLTVCRVFSRALLAQKHHTTALHHLLQNTPLLCSAQCPHSPFHTVFTSCLAPFVC